MIEWHMFYEFHVSFGVAIAELNQSEFSSLKSRTRAFPKSSLKMGLFTTNNAKNVKIPGRKKTVKITWIISQWKSIYWLRKDRNIQRWNLKIYI